MRLEQAWLVLDNPWPRPPKEDNIVSGIYQHNSISSRDQLGQDSGVGTARFQLQNAMPCQYFWHLSGDRWSARHESRRAFEVYGGYLFEYYQLWDIEPRHGDHRKNWSSESCWMHKWSAQLSLQQEVHLTYPTTNHQCSSRWIFSHFPSLWGAPVQNQGSPEMGDVPKGIVYIWKHFCSILFQRYVNTLQSNYHHQAGNWVERGTFARHLLIGMNQFWSCPVPASDVDPSKFSFAG